MTSAGSSGRVPSDSRQTEGWIDGWVDGWVGRWIVEWIDCRLRATCVLHSIGDNAHVQCRLQNVKFTGHVFRTIFILKGIRVEDNTMYPINVPYVWDQSDTDSYPP